MIHTQTLELYLSGNAIISGHTMQISLPGSDLAVFCACKRCIRIDCDWVVNEIAADRKCWPKQSLKNACYFLSSLSYHSNRKWPAREEWSLIIEMWASLLHSVFLNSLVFMGFLSFSRNFDQWWDKKAWSSGHQDQVRECEEQGWFVKLECDIWGFPKRDN